MEAGLSPCLHNWRIQLVDVRQRLGGVVPKVYRQRAPRSGMHVVYTHVEWAVRFAAAGFTDRKEGRAGSVLPLTRRDVSSSVPLPGQPWSPRRPAHLNAPDVRSTPRLCALAGSASSTPRWGANECSSRHSSSALAASPWLLLAVCVQLGLAARKAQDVGRNSRAATEPASLAAAGAT